MMADADRGRLASVIATNQEMARIVRDIGRHGEMSEEDMRRVEQLSHEITKNTAQAEFKLAELARVQDLNRKERRKRLDKLLSKRRLEYWLAFQVQAELP